METLEKPLSAGQSMQIKCRKCGEMIMKKDCKKHQMNVHGAVYGKLKSSHSSTPVLDRLRLAEQEIQKACRELETERDLLHDKIVEIDNKLAKYKQFNEQ